MCPPMFTHVDLCSLQKVMFDLDNFIPLSQFLIKIKSLIMGPAQHESEQSIQLAPCVCQVPQISGQSELVWLLDIMWKSCLNCQR